MKMLERLGIVILSMCMFVGQPVMAAETSYCADGEVTDSYISEDAVDSKLGVDPIFIYVTEDGMLVDPGYMTADYEQPYYTSYAYACKINTDNKTACGLMINDEYFVGKYGNNYDLVIPGEIKVTGVLKEEFYDLTSKVESYKGTYKVTDITGASGSFKSIKFPEGGIKVTSSSAFYECNNLTEVTIPANVELAGDRAFQNCKNLQKVVIGDGYITIPNRTFADCTKLEDVVLPESLTSIGEQAFMNCKSLTKIGGSTDCIIPNNVTTIGEGAFGNCGFVTMTLPKDLKYGWGFFSGLYLASLKLTDIKVASGGTTGFYAEDGILYYNDSGKIKLVAYPSGKIDDSSRILFISRLSK